MKRLFSNSVFAGIETFTIIGLSLVATPVLINGLGVEGYGVFVFLSIFSVYGALMLFDFGMEGSLMNYVARFDAARDVRKIQDCLVISLLFYGMIGLMLATILFLFGDFVTSRFMDDAGTLDRALVLVATKVVALNVFVQFLTLPFVAILQGLRRFVISKSVSTTLMVIQYTMLMVIAIQYHRIDLAFAVVLGVSVLRLIIFIGIFRFKLPNFTSIRPRIDFSLLKTLLGYSSILFISRIIGLIFNQMDKFLIWLFLAVSSMTIYAVVVRPAHLIRVLISIINSAIIPEVARLHQDGEIGGIRVLYINLVRYAYLVILPALAVGYAHMGTLLTLWVGEDLARYAYMVPILLSVWLLAPMPAVGSTVVVGMELIKKVIWIPIVATVINIVLSLVLLKYLGLIGLLVATLASEVFMVFPYLAFMKRILAMPTAMILAPTFKILVSSVPFAVLHLCIAGTTEGSLFLWFLLVTLVSVGHYVVNYRFLLTSDERSYVANKLGVNKILAYVGTFVQ